MFSKVIVCLSMVLALTTSAPAPATGLLAGAPFVTATSSQVIARNYNAAFAIAAPARLVQAAPLLAAPAPLVQAAPLLAAPAPLIAGPAFAPSIAAPAFAAAAYSSYAPGFAAPLSAYPYYL